MNRKEASKFIGKRVRVVDPLLGSYIGELMDIIAEPRKPWRGLVKIKMIEQYPVQQLSSLSEITLNRPPFQDEQTYEIIGSKIEVVESAVEELDFEQSLKIALLNEIHHYKEEREKITHVLNELEKEFQTIVPNHLPSSNQIEYQYYTLCKEKDEYLLVDDKNIRIPLEDNPFQFQIKVKNKWVNVDYLSEFTFIDHKQKKYQLANGSEIRLNKEQFDPYHLFINELELPALNSLLNGLKKFNMGHSDYVNCHNTLLNQYLTSDQQKYFKGVNFISYQKDNVTLLVQHHYERIIHDDREDVTYDRFEFTNNEGKRLLMTYTTENQCK